jgi:hypothetical protein
MKPGEPLKRKTPLARSPLTRSAGIVHSSQTPKRRARLSPQSKKKKEEDRAAHDDRYRYLHEHQYCEVGWVLSHSENQRVKDWVRLVCHHKAECINERQKRSAGGSLTDPSNLQSSCFPCNQFLEDHPEVARLMGCVVYAHENPEDIPVRRKRI